MADPADFVGMMYRFRAHYQQKEFVGQKAIRTEIEDVGGDSVAEVLDAIWVKAQPWIKREVLVDADKFSFAEKEQPDRDEIGNFIILQHKGAKTNYSVSQLTSNVLQKLRDKDISVLVHVYGNAIASKPIHSKMAAAILQPVDRDRAGAHSTVALVELTRKLKETHGQHLSGNTSSWTMWANSIHSAPPCRQEAMAIEMPPPHLIHLFRSVPITESETVRSAQHGLQIAGNINDSYTESVQTLRREFENVKEAVGRVFALYEVRLKATEEMLVANGRLVGAMGDALHIEVNATSLEEEQQVTDAMDLDHS